jgi:hypothetical protein
MSDQPEVSSELANDSGGDRVNFQVPFREITGLFQSAPDARGDKTNPWRMIQSNPGVTLMAKPSNSTTSVHITSLER